MSEVCKNTGLYKKYFNRDVLFSFLLLFCGSGAVMGLIHLEGESIYELFPVWFGYIFIGSMIVSIGYFIFLALSALTYKVDKTVLEEAALPFCTVLVPAYNEGKHVADTLQSLLHVEYPAEKLEIIAINDGSKDDTLFWIRSVAEKSGGRVRYIDLEKKRRQKTCPVYRDETGQRGFYRHSGQRFPCEKRRRI